MENTQTGQSSGATSIPFMNTLFAAIQAAPSADNAQPCHIDWSPSKLILRYDSERVSGVTFPFESRATLLSAGAVIENIAQCCEQAGVAMRVTYFPVETPASKVFAEIALEEIDNISDVSIKSPLFFRQTNRFAYKKKAIPQDAVDELMTMVIGTSKVMMLQDHATIDAIGRQVQDASEIRFQTQEVHEWLERCLRFTPEQAAAGDGLDIRTLDLPPGGGMFLRFISSWQRMHRLNRIGAYKLLATIDALPVKKAPAVVAVTAPDTPVGMLEAGRLLCRAWAYLNSQGLACHPYYVISDQLERLKDGKVPVPLITKAEKIGVETQRLLSIKEGETLMMLLRVGYPTREAPRSRRLSMDQVFTKLP